MKMKENLNNMPDRLRNALSDDLIAITSLVTTSQLYNNLDKAEHFRNLSYVGFSVFSIAVIQTLYNIAQYNLKDK